MSSIVSASRSASLSRSRGLVRVPALVSSAFTRSRSALTIANSSTNSAASMVRIALTSRPTSRSSSAARLTSRLVSLLTFFVSASNWALISLTSTSRPGPTNDSCNA
jgi:hypothetical protein